MIIIIFLVVILLGWLSYYHYSLAVTLLAGLLPTYLLRTQIGPIPTTLLELSIVVVTLVGSSQPGVRKQWRLALATIPPVIWLAVSGFVVAATLSTYISPEPRLSWGLWKGWVITPLLLAWLVYTVTSTNESQRLIWRALQWSGVVVVVFGFLVNTQARFTGIYDVPNSLALFLVPLAVYSLWQRHWLPSIILVLALAGTQSIGGLVALGTSLGIGYLLWRRTQLVPSKNWWPWVLMTISLVIYLLGTGRLVYLAQPLHHGAPNSVSVRLQLWQASLTLITQHPWLGIGLGQFEPNYQQWLHQQYDLYQQGLRSQSPLPEFVFRDPHNWMASMWLNLGLLGLLSWLLLNGYLLIQQWRLRKSWSTQAQATYLALVSILLFGLVDTIYWKNDLAGMYWVLVALSIRVLVRPQA